VLFAIVRTTQDVGSSKLSRSQRVFRHSRASIVARASGCRPSLVLKPSGDKTQVS